MRTLRGTAGRLAFEEVCLATLASMAPEKIEEARQQAILVIGPMAPLLPRLVNETMWGGMVLGFWQVLDKAGPDA